MRLGVSLILGGSALFLVRGSLSRLNRGKREAKTSHIYSRVLPDL